MLTLAALTFPNIDPVAINIGPLSIKWYGLAYMSGLILGWLYVRRLITTPHLWKDAKAPFTIERVDDLLLYITLAVIVGGRLGQVLLYEPGILFRQPGRDSQNLARRHVVPRRADRVGYRNSDLCTSVQSSGAHASWTYAARRCRSDCCSAGSRTSSTRNTGAARRMPPSAWCSQTAAACRAIPASSMKQRSKAS